jgi:hypothetical protein
MVKRFTVIIFFLAFINTKITSQTRGGDAHARRKSRPVKIKCRSSRTTLGLAYLFVYKTGSVLQILLFSLRNGVRCAGRNCRLPLTTDVGVAPGCQTESLTCKIQGVALGRRSTTPCVGAGRGTALKVISHIQSLLFGCGGNAGQVNICGGVDVVKIYDVVHALRKSRYIIHRVRT